MSMRFRIVCLGLRSCPSRETDRQCGAAVRAVAVSVVFLPLRIFGRGALAQTDLAIGRTQLDDLEFELFPNREAVLDFRPSHRHLSISET